MTRAAVGVLACAVVLTVAVPVEPAQRPWPSALAAVHAEWLKELANAGHGPNRGRVFRSPGRDVLVARLTGAASTYHFKIVSILLLHPVQLAPELVIRSDDRGSIQAAIPKIVVAVDPIERGRRFPNGVTWAYEGIFVAVRDSKARPYIAVWVAARGPHVAGGQWAIDGLYPYLHG
jgi:hypothetical protein